MSQTGANRLKAMLAERAARLAASEKLEAEKLALHKQIELRNVPIAAPVVQDDDSSLVSSSSSVVSESPDVPETPVIFQYNEEQQRAIDFGSNGTEFCLIGAAGTGKTTTLRKVLENLMSAHNINKDAANDKTFAIVCYTRRASRNAAKALAPIGAGKFCMTAHAFLEYQPEYDEYSDADGNLKKTMRFVPTRHSGNPILNCRLIVIDEASMLSYTGLYAELVEAAPQAKFIFVGDLNQLPPVFGDAVLGYKLAELPVVELSRVYRQAMDSPIIAFQHNYTLKGTLPSDLDLEKITASATDDKGLQFLPFKATHQDGEVLAEAVANYMLRQLDAGLYDPDQDTILIPFNKSFGSIAINWHLADSLGARREAVVWEIFAGREHKYLAVGDFVMYEKSEATIIDIQPNPKYFGKPTQNPSSKMRRNGLIKSGNAEVTINLDQHTDFVQMGVDELLAMDDDSAGEMKRAASAIVTIRDNETGVEKNLSSNGEINALDFGYAMTIHKSQGSEWRKVWLVVHNFHRTMLTRELLYTGMTRAKEKLTVIYSKQTALGRKDSSIAKAIKKAAIPGKSWQQKVEYFKGKMRD
jgi:exodeoxyribonuclease V alpha subunit